VFPKLFRLENERLNNYSQFRAVYHITIIQIRLFTPTEPPESEVVIEDEDDDDEQQIQ
ncbi:unnamed protein product, partial [Didymodactylos carnosus]